MIATGRVSDNTGSSSGHSADTGYTGLRAGLCSGGQHGSRGLVTASRAPVVMDSLFFSLF